MLVLYSMASKNISFFSALRKKMRADKKNGSIRKFTIYYLLFTIDRIASIVYRQFVPRKRMKGSVIGRESQRKRAIR